jgi:S-adenosylmethionine:tRNA-ribosyltransferase-isomerase (queuine synthetase)
MLTLDDFDFDLPGELIAQHPTAERTASRLLQLADGAACTTTASATFRNCSQRAICWYSTIRE